MAKPKADAPIPPTHLPLAELDRLPGFEPARTVATMLHRSPADQPLRWFVGFTNAGDVLTLEEPAGFCEPWILKIRRKSPHA